MTVASIDIGTNTVLLLIAKIVKNKHLIEPLYEEQRMPRLGKGLKKNGKISDEKIEMLLSILSDYKKKTESYNSEIILVTATNALRIANNSKEIIQMIKSNLNLSVDVITGDREAEFAYLGAISEINNIKTQLVIDIGGGSTELIYGNNDKIIYKKSFHIGSVSATEQFLIHLPPLAEEIHLLRRELGVIFNEIKSKFQPDLVIGIAGTATTLACMIQGLSHFDREKVNGSLIFKTELDDLVSKISKIKPENILDKYGEILKGREDIITGGAIILSELLAIINSNSIGITSRGIRYGAIVSDLFY
ncbi:MAG: rod shape-determining protein [Ignavibacteria bacterium]|nr:rod shape-determining protein [Ignavibacteria bacterium]MBT8381688.1 rod shape-determining protein [Ignavibacteria bacterium]MBT8390309.1 rod shape-determining protein [Ignavibacteria bacterium]NNJ53076.1 hypothetical protein [Ignavibacteriaceae bacterium]NNL20280.1 hypothetical protein [Ignavibacteriaceae bacterium]